MRNVRNILSKIIFCSAVLLCSCNGGRAMDRDYSIPMLPLYVDDLMNSQQTVQSFLAFMKTVLFLDADVYSEEGNLEGKQKAAWSRVMGRLASLGVRLFDENTHRDWVSKGAHAASTGLQLAQDAEELLRIKKTEKKSPETSLELVKEWYPYEHDPEKNGVKTPFGIAIKPYLRLLELGMNLGYINSDNNTYQLGFLIAQSICELLLRFGFKTGQYQTKSMIGKIEAVATTGALSYDIGKVVYNKWHAYHTLKKAEELTDSCSICREKYADKGSKIAYKLKCGHWFCIGCVNKGEWRCPLEICGLEKEIQETKLLWDNDNPETCSICLADDLMPDNVETRVLPCGHYFHQACIEQWFEANTGRTCSICRVHVPKEEE